MGLWTLYRATAEDNWDLRDYLDGARQVELTRPHESAPALSSSPNLAVTEMSYFGTCARIPDRGKGFLTLFYENELNQSRRTL
jgi:hypothetical protein